MKLEVRIYLANLTNWYNDSTDIENIMECAESQGSVWTLEGFTKAYNNIDSSLYPLLVDKEHEVIMATAVFAEDGTITSYTVTDYD